MHTQSGPNLDKFSVWTSDITVHKKIQIIPILNKYRINKQNHKQNLNKSLG